MGDICRISYIYGLDDELMKDTAIEVRSLKKSYGAVPAVNGISFSVRKGQLAALLGPNGAGKSTVINILSTITDHDDGDVFIEGMDTKTRSKRVREIIGVVFQKGVLDERLTVAENFRVRADFYGLRGRKATCRIEEIAHMTGTRDLRDRYYGQLSGGQKRRCDIARALIHSPRILLMDEPTAGLDPDIRNSLWETIDKIRVRTGMTIIMTTHYLEEAALADNIIVMNKGKIVYDGSPGDMKCRFSKDMLVLYSSHKARRISLLDTVDALKILENEKGRYESFEVIKGSIEAAYMSLIGEHSRDIGGSRDGIFDFKKP